MHERAPAKITMISIVRLEDIRVRKYTETEVCQDSTQEAPKLGPNQDASGVPAKRMLPAGLGALLRLLSH